MPSIHFRTTVDAPPEAVYDALATQDGLAGSWTDQLEVPDHVGASARFGGTVVHFSHGGWSDEQAEGEMAMCGYTWAMIIERLRAQAARGTRAPYFTAAAPLPL